MNTTSPTTDSPRIETRGRKPTLYTPIDDLLVNQIRQYKINHRMGDEALGKLMGCSGSQINRAINAKFEGDARAFEARAADFFKSDAVRRKAVIGELWDNAFSKRVANFLNTVRRTEDVGLGFSVAGSGKTCAITLYAKENPTALFLTMSEWNRGSGGLQRLIWDAIDTRGWNGYSSRGDFIVARFKGSRRLIIIDNAHRLSGAARKFLFDFHDATGCPIALIGNPEILTEIRRNDQQFSRIGLKREFKAANTADEAATVAQTEADRLVAAHWPDAVGQLGNLPLQVVTQAGRSRALRKQLLLAKDLAAAGLEPIAAFRAAHTQLVRDYTLK